MPAHAAEGQRPEAVSLLQAQGHPVDLLLTDVVIPHMTGGELADLARRIQPGVRTLFMSGYAQRTPRRPQLNQPHAPD